MTRIAVVPVRAGRLPAGALDAAAEAGGRAILVDTEPTAPFASVAREVAALVADDDVIVLPASPDGRDLAPALAHHLGRPLLAGAIEVTDSGALCARWGGRVVERIAVDGPFVATIQPNVTGALVPPNSERTGTVTLTPQPPAAGGSVEVVDILPPDVATMDLAEATRIVGGGAGLDSADRFAQLRAVAGQLGASMGCTRVITDRGWIEHERQIGTTGVSVSPEVYLAFGISGAVQHTAGLGDPAHVIAVNTDPHCPMMQLADLAIVADANATLDELAARLRSTDSGDTRSAKATHG